MIYPIFQTTSFNIAFQNQTIESGACDNLNANLYFINDTSKQQFISEFNNSAFKVDLKQKRCQFEFDMKDLEDITSKLVGEWSVQPLPFPTHGNFRFYLTVSGIPQDAVGYQMNFKEWASSYNMNGEPTEVALFTKEVPGGTSISSIYEIINYQYYDDLWHRKLGNPVLSKIGKRTTLNFERESLVQDPNTITF